jgi:hypothetical protein
MEITSGNAVNTPTGISHAPDRVERGGLGRSLVFGLALRAKLGSEIGVLE